MKASSYYTYYARQAAQTGEGDFFIGPAYQRGYGLGGIFRNIFNFIRPLVKPAAKFVGKEILKTGANILTDVASGRNVKESAKEHLPEAGSHILDTAVTGISKMRKKLRGGKRPIKRKGPCNASHSKRKRLRRRTRDILD